MLTGIGTPRPLLIWVVRLAILKISIKTSGRGMSLTLFLLAVYLIMRQHLIMAAAIQLKTGTLAK